MTPAELHDEIASGRLGGLYLLYGEERLLVEEAADAVQRSALAGALPDFNLHRFRGRETGAGALETALGTLPMMAARRLVVVRDVEDVPDAAKEVLQRFVEAPPPTTVLLCIGEKVDLRQQPFRAMAKAGRGVKFETPWERDLVPWCRARARLQGASMDEAAARLLVDAVGRDMSGLAGAVERLVLYAGSGARIDTAAVEAAVPETREHSVFALCDAAGGGEVRRAWALMRKVGRQREPALRVLALLARHFRQLLRLREQCEAGRSREDAGQALGLAPWALKNLWPQAQRHTIAGLRRAVEHLYQADIALKSSALSPDVLLERLIVDLCRVESSAVPGSRR